MQGTPYTENMPHYASSEYTNTYTSEGGGTYGGKGGQKGYHQPPTLMGSDTASGYSGSEFTSAGYAGQTGGSDYRGGGYGAAGMAGGRCAVSPLSL